MTSLEKLSRQHFGAVAVDFWRDDHGELWMTAEQIGQALEFTNPQQSVLNIFNRYRHRLEDKSVQIKMVSTDGKSYETRLFSRLGLYEILRHSTQPKADDFFDWVWDVLEQIRTTGFYVLESAPKMPTDFVEALEMLLASEKAKKAQAAQLALQAPKVALYDTAMQAVNAQPISTVAKVLGVGPNKLFAWLRDEGILMRHGSRYNLPKAEYMDRGLFTVREYSITHMTQGIQNKAQTLVTAKGLAYIHDRWQRAHEIQEVSP